MSKLPSPFVIAAFVTVYGLMGTRPCIRHNRKGMCPPPDSDINTPPVSLGANPTVISVTATGSRTSGVGAYGPNSTGTGLSPLTPSGVLTTTGGIQEAFDYLKSIGGGVVEITANASFKGQIVFRNGVTVRGNNYLLSNTATNAACPTPFLTDVDIAMASKTDLLGVNLSAGSVARTDTIINAPGATTIGASPYTYTNSTPGYTILVVTGGTVSAITNGGNALANAYGCIAVAPGTSVVVTYTAGAGTTPTVVLVGGILVLGSGYTNNFDITCSGTNGGNGVNGCGFVSPAGTDLGNCYSNHFLTLGITSTTGLFAYRWFGAGGANNDAFVNNQIDLLYAQGFAAGGSAAGYGITFSAHTDSNHIAMAFLVPNSGAAAGSYQVAYNDGYFGLVSADLKVNANEIEWLIAAPNLATTNCNVALVNDSGLTANSGGPNVIRRFERVSSLTTPVVIANGGIFTGSDSTRGKEADWKLSQLNQLGVTPTVQHAPANVSTITLAATFKMMGLGADGTDPCVVTPNLTGKLKVTLTCQVETSVAADGFKIALYQHTGAAPANGVGVTGTIMNQNAKAYTVTPGNSDYVIVTIVGFAAGLTVGTQYWVDAAVAWVTTGGTLVAQNVDVLIEELAA